MIRKFFGFFEQLNHRIQLGNANFSEILEICSELKFDRFKNILLQVADRNNATIFAEGPNNLLYRA